MTSPSRHYALALTLILLLSPALAFAEKRYISDTLIISLRDTPSVRGEVVSYLRSGDALEVIEENEEGFILVEAASGERGWIQKKYTIDEKPKDWIIANLKEQVKSLTAKVEAVTASTTSLQNTSQAVKNQLSNKEKEIGQLRETIIELQEAASNAEKKYEDLSEKSQDVVTIIAERDSLLERLKTVEQEAARLRVENAELIQTGRLLWFLAGFGVFLVGWIMGKMSAKSRRRSLSM